MAPRTQPHTLVHLLAHWAEKRPAQPAIHGKKDGQWFRLSWSEYLQRSRAVAKALIHLGHEVGEKIVLLGANRPEWVQIQSGAQIARGVPAPIYGTSTHEQTAYIISNSESRFWFCDGEEQVEKLLECERRELCPKASTIVTFLPFAHDDERVMSLADFIDLGHQQADTEVDARFDALTEDETCLMIYTSGTTGVPKGVEIDHGGQMLIGRSVLKLAPEFGDGRADYHHVSYLPLSHQAEQILTNIATLTVGGQVYFCPEIAQVKDYLTEVRPTVFLGVPRVWEKFEAALRARLGEATGIKAKLAQWARDTEYACFEEQVARGVRPEEHMPIKRRVARALVIDKVKTALGLDRLTFALTGSAPMAPRTQEFFASLGIAINDAYGLTETSGVATISDPLRPRFGTVGKPLDGVEVRIGDNSEIQLRGRNMVKGYFEMPDKTAELYTEDGWLRTGDQGAFDDEGNLKITGRIKELIITAGGKNVAPVELEHYIAPVPGVGQVVVVGDRKPFLSALITLDPENLDALAEAAGTKKASMAEMAADPKVRAFFEREIESRCNSHVARYQTIKKFHILPSEFTVDGGELTASMKLRRPQIVEKYDAEIEAFYAGGTKTTPVRA
jgi:long-chain acyl-CoA synthetase